MAKYFTITNGLRGMYMPDGGYTLRAKTRRELKDALESEAQDLRDAGFIGASKRAVASLAAAAWRNAQRERPDWREHVMPLAPAHSRGNYCYALAVSLSNRREYLAQED